MAEAGYLTTAERPLDPALFPDLAADDLEPGALVSTPTAVGYESGTTVTSDYTARDSRFTGKINWVQLDLGKDDYDHFIDPGERLRIALSQQ